MIKKLVLAHAIIEIVAGIVLIMKPSLVFMTELQDVHALMIAKIYGIAIATFGAVCLQISKIFDYTDEFKRIILAIMLFHLFIAFQMYAGYNQGQMPNLGPFGLHMILALVFGVGFMREMNLFDKK